MSKDPDRADPPGRAARLDLEALRDYAAASHDLLRADELPGVGLSSRAPDRRAARLRSVRRGVYTLEPATSPEEQHLQSARAVQATRSDTTLSHVSAALVHGLPVDRRRLTLVHVTAPTRRGRRAGVHSHGARLSRTDVQVIDDLAVTAPTRTVLDCALSLPLFEAVSIVDSALNGELATIGQLWRDLTRLGHRHGLGRARRALALSDAKCESPGETRVRILLGRAGFELESQVVIRDEFGGFVARVDFRLVGSSVVIEFDGRGKYSLNGDAHVALWNEKRRQDALHALGYEVVRIIWEDLQRPAGLVAKVKAAMARADRRG